MGLIKIINACEFDSFQSTHNSIIIDENVNTTVSEIIEAVRKEGDNALRRYAARFEKAVPENFEVPAEAAEKAWEKIQKDDPALTSALIFAADNIRRFAELQKKQLSSFETEIAPGLFTGQNIIPVNRAAIYVPAGRFPLFSSALMALIPAAVAGVKERILVSPPGEGGFPDSRILAAAHHAGAKRFFALGGAQAIAALALGTETIPKVDLIAGPGNKYVAAAKKILFGEVGIDFIAGPTDVLIITEEATEPAADLAAADMVAQAEHDPDACARALVPNREMALAIEKAYEKRLALSSFNKNGLILIYKSKEEAVEIANRIAPEHLELHVSHPNEWMENLINYGSLFIGASSAEVLGDYSAGINHTLPTSGAARFTGGLSVRNFLKASTTLRCVSGKGYRDALTAAEIIAKAEGLTCHAESARIRLNGK